MKRIGIIETMLVIMPHHKGIDKLNCCIPRKDCEIERGDRTGGIGNLDEV
ncbi:MAG: hypothetical protein NTU90_09215 [Proteobacteria bacterium]|nr:hypothetical protein [Pseudomonadota bacterium]